MHALFVKGGPLMWPLVLCSLITLTVISERLLFWFKLKKLGNNALSKDIVASVLAGESVNLSSTELSAIDSTARVLVTASKAKCLDSRRAAIFSQAKLELASARRGLSILDMMISLTPLLGILGTVVGIIHSFDLMHEHGVQDPASVIGGVAQALITTASGLSIAILALIAYRFFVSRLESLKDRIEFHGEKYLAAFVADKKGGKA